MLSEYIDAPHAWDIYEYDKYDEESKKQWAKNIYVLFLLLKRSQIIHGDLKAQNILCSPQGALFIDLDGMKSNQSCKGFSYQFKKDINRFNRSWLPEGRGNRFFQCYLKKLLCIH